MNPPKKTIFICFYRKKPISGVFNKRTQNPGIGGTQFTCIRFAFYLAEYMPDSHVVLVSNKVAFSIKTDLENLSLISIDDFDDFFEQSVIGSYDITVISPKYTLARVSSKNLKNASSKVIAWSRHPFDNSYPLTEISFAACVCVGAYQYYSNKFVKSPMWHIPHLFFSPVSIASDFDRNLTKFDDLRIVYLGALVEAKGFLWIAKEWKKIKSIFPNVKLHVIGSAGTYGVDNELHAKIPAINSYAEQILNYIDIKDLQDGRVIFHGNLGSEKFAIIKNCHVGIINPTGESESFCSSAVEILSCGVPLISSNDYGMFETMRFFPELSIKNPSEMSLKLMYLVGDLDIYNELRARAFFVGQYFHNQTPVVMNKWVRLIKSVQSVSVVDAIPPLNRLDYGRYNLYCRLYRQWLLANFPGWMYLRKFKRLLGGLFGVVQR